MKIAVTGATGHVGLNLVEQLVSDGHQVRAFASSGLELLDHQPVERIQGDVRDEASLLDCFRDVDRVFHLAAVNSIDGDRGGLVSDVNVRGARTSAQAALQAGVERFVHFSSIHAFDIHLVSPAFEIRRTERLRRFGLTFNRFRQWPEVCRAEPARKLQSRGHWIPLRRACLVLAVETNGHNVETIEGMADGDNLHPLQQKFLEHSALQCGICTPGILVAAKALLEIDPDPTETRVRYWLAGNLCRCTGYDKIVRAVLDAAAEMRAN